MKIYRKLSSRPLVLWSIAIFGLIGAFVFINPTHVAAAYSCGVHNNGGGAGDNQQAAGMVVDVKWVPYGASNANQDNTSQVQVTTHNPSPKNSTPGNPNPGGVAKMAAPPALDNSELSLNSSKIFNQVPANCTLFPGGGGSGYNGGNEVVLGYGVTSPDAGSGWQYWALDCEEQARAGQGYSDNDVYNPGDHNHFQPFDVTGVGTPAGARSGGTWNTVTVAPMNGNTAYVVVTYTEPPPPPNYETCPGDPTFQNPKESNLESSGLPGSGDFDTTGAGPPGAEGHKYEWKSPNLYHISNVTDQYGMQATNWTGKDTNNNNENPFKIWYNDYINQYPYDSHHVTVYYKAFYTDHLWKATGTLHDAGTTRTDDDHRDWEGPYDSTGSVDLSKTAQDWAECYHRGFQVQPLPLSAQLGNTYENPTHASFGFTVPVNFYLPDVAATGLRNPMKICGLSYSASYYIKNAAGANIGPLPGHGSDGGGVPGGCINSSGSPTGSGSASWNSGPYGFASGTLHAGDEICVSFSVWPGGDRMNQDGTALNNTGTVSNTQCSAPVVNEPYFKVYNSGISAGGDFGACGSTGGLLASWNDNTGADRGASAQLSALALIKITGVASAQTAAGRSPTELSFANTAGAPLSTDGQSPDLGGAFGGTNCLTNISAPLNAPAETVNNPTVGSSPLDDGSHSYSTGNVTLNSGSIANSKNVGVYINGRDVYIKNSGNNGIKYSGAGGPWTINNTSTDVPSFTLVVSGGNIYIDPSITELDGIYVAQKDGAGHGGTIYTCGSASGSTFSPMSASNLYGSCYQQLTIYGNFVANQVNLMRTYGSLRDAQAGEQPGGGAHSCNYTGGLSNSPVCAGEVFRFSPELYLTNQATSPPSHGALIEESRISLPPVL